jgi:hypothetical protein
MSFSAAIPASLMQSANSTLAALGYGPGNFSVPAYSGAAPSFALLHSWNDATFQVAVTAISGVTIQQGESGPDVITIAAAQAVGSTWGNDATLLAGIVSPGLHKDSLGKLWWVIQSYNTATWPDPSAPGLTALVVPARTPGEAVPWYQTFAADAFKLVNPFTGVGDICTHNGKTWRVTQADGSGNNVWAPGVFGWTEIV